MLSDGVRAVVQRVARAEVRVGDQVVGRIERGLLVFVGAAVGDGDGDAAYLAEKVIALRIFPDEQGQMNRGVLEIGGALLVVSQFTLLADCRKGRRPSFAHALEPVGAERLYQRFVAEAEKTGVPVETGRFRAPMQVELVNDGPVTLLLDSKRLF